MQTLIDAYREQRINYSNYQNKKIKEKWVAKGVAVIIKTEEIKKEPPKAFLLLAVLFYNLIFDYVSDSSSVSLSSTGM